MTDPLVLPATLAQEREFRGAVDRLGWRNLAIGWRVSGPLDADGVRRSLRAMAERHELLRSCVADVAGEVVQLVARELEPPLDVVDLEHDRGRARTARLRRGVSAGLARPFDLARVPLWRATLFRLGSREHVLLLVVCHTIWDAYSSLVFAREFSRLGDGSPPLEPLPVQMGDIAGWERAFRDGAAEAFWAGELAARPRRLPLPIDRARASERHYQGRDVAMPEVPPWVVRSLNRLAEAEHTTLAATFLGAFALLLRRDTGQEQIVIGVDEANRDRPETRDLIGYLLNVIPVRVRIDRAATFRDVVASAGEALSAAYRHRLPLRRVAALAAPDEPPYEATLNVRPYDDRLLNAACPDGAPIALRPWQPPVAWANFPVASVWWDAHVDLSLDVGASGAVSGELSYNAEALEDRLAQQLVRDLPRLLRRIARYPDRAVDRLAGAAS